MPKLRCNLSSVPRPFLLPQKNRRLVFEFADSGDDCRVVGESAIAAQFDHVRKNPRREIERLRALRMARDLTRLPRRDFGIKGAQFFLEILFELADSLQNLAAVVFGAVAQGVDRVLDGLDLFFEREKVSHSAYYKRALFVE